ncbi:T9SS type A sorting domain-containing protein [Flavobacterium sp.]|uniref:T9SS type A sorting domain-containing protein n=1 Tax=Flavobacterium sp. TaxID=239 RepID=UPI002B4ADEA3|nr:T9SS type A sorting domain-containing protein [Flavobacterium sp.]HLF50734.1 T9SS type A sorting domain-containing protein [Flavobacterium sp.]
MKKSYLFTLLFALVAGFTSNAQVVISQIYGGGGNSGATYTNDFIEIFNRGTVAQDLTGWSVQYASATGTSWAVTNLTPVVLLPGQYYLVQEAAGGTPSVALPTPDATGTIAMSGTTGKVILVNVTTAQTGVNPTGTQIIDKVGFGTTPNGFEGTGPTGTVLSNSLSAQRLNAGCVDADNNATDFTTGTPSARNTLTTISICSTAPSIAITSPANAVILSPETTNVNVGLSVSNFNVANGTGDGHIHYTINGGALVMKYDTTPIAVPTTPGAYTVYVELVDNAHAALVPAKNATVTFTVASYTNAVTLAAVRAAGVNAWVNYTGTSIVSFSRPLSTGRNQKYIQDATVGILVDDSAGLITTTFAAGDGISSLRGQLINFNGVMEFVPNQDATKPSTGNVIAPQVVTLADIAANIDAYESRLVQINGVTFAAGDGTAVFTVNTDYVINDLNASVFRTMFPTTEVDYIGAAIPQGPRNISVLVSENNGVARVAARSLADLTLSRNDFDAIDGLSMYPNPLSGKILNFSSAANADMSIKVYDVLGKEVLSSKVINNTVVVSNLNSGVYIVKITEEGKTATRKLIIR